MEMILRANGATLVRSNDIYNVLPLDEGGRAALAAGPAISDVQRGQGFGLRIIPLKFVGAAEVQKVLEPFLPAGGTLRTEAARNLLIVSGSQPELDSFVALAATVDIDFLAGTSFALLPLENASPQGLAGELERIFGNQSEGALAGVLRFIPIDRLNAILAVSSQPAYLARARAWVERLDRADEPGVPRLNVYYVQNSRAGDLAAVLGDIFSVTTELPQSLTAPGTRPTEIAPPFLNPQGTNAPGAGGVPPNAQGPGGQAPGTMALAPSAGGQPGGATGGASGLNPSPSSGGLFGSPTDQFASGPARNRAGRGAQARRLQAGAGLGGAFGEATDHPIRIVADEKNNAIVVFATPNDYRMVQNALRKLDIVPLQVLIEATIAEVTLNDALHFGVNLFLRQGAFRFSLTDTTSLVPGATIPTPVSPMFAVLVGKANPFAIITALSSITDVNVISSPQVMVLDHQTAFLQVGAQVPIAVQQATNLTAPNTVLINTIQFRDTGVILQVTPRVNANGLVTLEIGQEVSDVARTTTSNIDSPTINERRIQSSVAIQTGDTIALGGLIRDVRSTGKGGIPILSDLPVLGPLFGTTDNTTTRTELLVLLTPHVVGNSQQARDVTEELRRRLRAVIPLGRKVQ
jgi:general secretion pathway protein D